MTAEHPFGTLKMRMGATHILMKRLPKVATVNPEQLGLCTELRAEKSSCSVIHPSGRERRSFLLRELGDRRLGGDDQTRDRCGVLERGPHDFGRIDDAELH